MEEPGNRDKKLFLGLRNPKTRLENPEIQFRRTKEWLRNPKQGYKTQLS
jgi:hypothetical protein